MIYAIVLLLINTLGSLLVGACMLRLWMQRLRLGVRNPVGNFVLALTDWIVLPLRRFIPGVGGVDWSSVVAALLISAVAVLILAGTGIVLGAMVHLPAIEILIGFALVLMIKWSLYTAMMVVLIAAALSWVNPFSPLLPIFDALTGPLLRPLRRLMPKTGRVDLSPLILFLLIEIVLIVLQGLAQRWIGYF